MKRCRFPALLAALFLLTVWAHLALDRVLVHPLAPAGTPPAAPQRIVSLAPSITETLYALGLGPQVAGVTQFCAYPPETALVPQVAGFGEVHFEALVRARPDLVALPGDRTDNRLRLEHLGLPTLALDTLTLPGLMHSITLLGKATGREQEAQALLASLQAGLDAARASAKGRTRPRVLFSVMHASQDLGYIGEITAVGRDGFYSKLIRAAGGENVYRGELSFPRLSREAIIVLDPEVIIDVIPARDNPEGARKDWESLPTVSAVKNGRVLILTDPAHTVPGPRFAQTLAALSQAFHPPNPGGREARP